MEKPQKPRKKKKQILVIGRDALEHFETLRKAICDRGFQLLIHPSEVKEVQELNSEELDDSDVVIITHDREGGTRGSKDLLRVVGTLRLLRVSLVIIVLGAYGYKLRKRLQERATIANKNGLGEVAPKDLEKTLRDSGIWQEAAKDEPQQKAPPPES